MDQAFLNPNSAMPGCSGMRKEQVTTALSRPPPTNEASNIPSMDLEDLEKEKFDDELLRRASEEQEQAVDEGPEKKRKKGGRDHVASLMDGIHQGIIEGKRSTRAKKK
ncbi:uncharacterized protein LOC144644835 [Oculina patagonica]